MIDKLEKALIIYGLLLMIPALLILLGLVIFSNIDRNVLFFTIFILALPYCILEPIVLLYRIIEVIKE